jgi:hypothetical protein
VVRAGRRRQAVLVPHLLAQESAPDATDLRRITASLPKSWWSVADGDVDTVTGTGPVERAQSLPGDGVGKLVTRLFHMQQLAELKPLTELVRNVLEPAWSADEPWLRWDAGLILTTEGAVTSSHADRHHTFLLQLTGEKEVGVAVPGSREHAAVIARSMPSLRCAAMPPGVQAFRLAAGSALYLPPYSVHWSRSFEDSIALSCGWTSTATVRTGEVHQANAALLRLKVPPRPVGRRSDGLKVAALAAYRRVRPSGRQV